MQTNLYKFSLRGLKNKTIIGESKNNTLKITVINKYARLPKPAIKL